MSEFDYTPKISSLKLQRDQQLVQPDGRVDELNSTATFRIPTSPNCIIPQSVHVIGEIEFNANSYIGQSFGQLIDSVTVLTGSGDVISRCQQYHRLHAQLSDLSVTEQEAQSAWQQGLDLRRAGSTTQKVSGNEPVNAPAIPKRQFSLPLSLSGYFAANGKYLSLEWTRGLQIQVRFRPGSAFLSGIDSASRTYTLSGVQLKYQYVNPELDQQFIASMAKPKEVHFTETEVYETAVPASTSAVTIRIPCPSRYRSVRKATLSCWVSQKTDGVTSGFLTERRVKNGIGSFMARVGTKVFPSGDMIRGDSSLLDSTLAAHGGSQTGVLNYASYASDAADRFFVSMAFSAQDSLVSGMATGDATLELQAESKGGVVQSTAVGMVQGDCFLDTSSGMVRR